MKTDHCVSPLQTESEQKSRVIEKLSGEVQALEKALKASQHKGKRHKKQPTPSPTHTGTPQHPSPSTSPPPSSQPLPPTTHPTDTVPPSPSSHHYSTSDLRAHKSEVLVGSGAVQEGQRGSLLQPQQSHQDPPAPHPSEDPSLESTKL